MLLALPVVSMLLTATAAPVRYPGLPGLIDKAAVQFDQQVEQSMKAVQTVQVKTEELDSDGKVEHLEEELLRSVGEGASREFKLVHATRDGKDVTAEKLAKRAKWSKHREKKDGDSHGMDIATANPFSKDEQPKYLYWVVSPLPAPGQPIEIHFQPATPDSKKIAGDAWVEPATGAIHAIAFHPSDLPFLVDLLQVKISLDDHSGPVLRATQMDVDGAGHFLFWHKHFRVHLLVGYAADKT